MLDVLIVVVSLVRKMQSKSMVRFIAVIVVIGVNVVTNTFMKTQDGLKDMDTFVVIVLKEISCTAIVVMNMKEKKR